MREKIYEEVEGQLEDIFFKIIFEPILAVLKKSNAHAVLENAGEGNGALAKALRTGSLSYGEGKFSGDLSASISKELRALGAKFDKRSREYRIKDSMVPNWVKSVMASRRTSEQDLHRDMTKTLGYIEDSLDQAIEKNTVDARKTVHRVKTDFKEVGDKFKIGVKLSPESEERLAQEYNENMKLWINNFSKEMIGKLRGEVEKNALEGYRASSLVGRIQQKYETTKSKAKFLARQETALFMSDFRKERFKENGISRYIWSTSMDSKVRDDHKHLQGKVCFYDNPPIVDRATGRRGNPGADFNCRCSDRPILESVAAAA